MKSVTKFKDFFVRIFSTKTITGASFKQCFEETVLHNNSDEYKMKVQICPQEV